MNPNPDPAGPSTPTKRMGLRVGAPSSYAWAVLVFVALTVLVWLTIILVPSSALGTPYLIVARVTSSSVVAMTVVRVFIEEALFRGIIGGVLMDRFGARLGNLVQAGVYALAYTGVLLVDVGLWPFIVAQFLAGLALGALRHRAGSFIPGAIAHAAANLAAASLVLV